MPNHSISGVLIFVIWAVSGAVISALTMNVKTKKQEKVVLYFLWVGFSAVLGILTAAAHIPSNQDDSELKRCPFYRELINVRAIVHKCCKNEFT